MKRLTSIFLALSMLASLAPTNIFAAQSENAGRYNSLKIPVVNEVREEKNNDIAAYDAIMSSAYGDVSNSGVNVGGGASGGSSSSAAQSPVITINGIPKQTENKGEQLVIKNVNSYFSEEDVQAIENLYSNSRVYGSVIEYKKDNKVSTLYMSDCLYGNIISDDETDELLLPVPAELENGTYNVSIHQLNDIWDYRDYGISELVFNLDLDVTDANPENEYPYTLNPIKALEEDSFSMVEGDFGYDRPKFTFTEALPGDAVMDGFARNENGEYFILNATATGSAFECRDNINVLPAGKYECYFHVSRPYYDCDEDTNELYGPIELNIIDAAFENEYYHQSSTSEYMVLALGKSISENLPEDLESQSCTVSAELKNKAGQTVHTINNMEVDNMGISMYGSEITFYMNLIGMDVGTYYVDLTLFDESGDKYPLGEAALNITDKTILDYISIENYGSQLTTGTESFYVSIRTSNMFVDYDKISINLLDGNGKVVGETISKELLDTYTTSSELLFKIKVNETLEESYLDYTLDVRSEKDLELITSLNNVYINVTSLPKIVRSELLDDNTVKIYTENLIAGEYLVTESYSDIDNIYNITIDEQGIGIFRPDSISESYHSFYLKTLEEKMIDSFHVRVSSGNDNFYSNPSFISVNTTKIDNFYVRALTQCTDCKDSNIEYARITQNGEVIATMSNFDLDDWFFYANNDQGYRLDLSGDITVVAGKSFTKGNATFEIKYTDGFIYTHDIPVTDENTDIYGDLEPDNYAYSNNYVSGLWTNYAVGSNKVSFTISDTNVTSGTISLHENNPIDPIETLNLSDLTKTVSNGYYYTYKGTFNTELSSDKSYYMSMKVNDSELYFGRFSYYPGKTASQYDDLTALNGECYVSLSKWINISNINNLTYKAVSGKNTYNLPVKNSYYKDGDDYISLTVDTSSLPAGYYTLKVYDGNDEVKLNPNTIGFNFGNVSKPITSGCGWDMIGAKRDEVEFRLYGANLDMVNEASVKIYKSVDFKEIEYNSHKLQYVKTVNLSKPYSKTYIPINNALLAGLETGPYTFVYVIDGKPSAAQDVFIKGSEPSYNASVVLNDGINFTNKDNATLAVSATGYTKMKVAFSKAELETAQYETISATKNISLTGKNGLVNIFVQFANNDESKTEIIEKAITVDCEAPLIEDVNIPLLAMWQNTEITFTSNELLRNAFIVIGNINEETGKIEGRNYVFAYQFAADGKYSYKCNLYADSQYLDIDSAKVQIVAYDKAGNESHTEISDLTISQPKDISGTVTYNDSPVEYADIYLYDENGNNLSYTRTDSNGQYRFMDILAGNYSIKAGARGYKQEEIEISANEFTGDITGKDFALTSLFENESAVTINLKDYNNEAVADAYVSLYSRESYVNLYGKTDSDGNVTINVPYKNGGTAYRVYATHSNYSSSEYITVDDTTESVNIIFPQKATINGVVLNGETKVANTEIIIDGNGYTIYAQTNENGEFTADVYLIGGNKTFVVTVRDNSNYYGSADVTFEEELTANVVLNLTGNIRVKGSIKDNMSEYNGEYNSIVFSGNNLYLNVTPDENGEFETPDSFRVGTYNVYVSPSNYQKYKSIETSFEITEDDMSSPAKELNLLSEKNIYSANFTSSNNKITATSDVIAKGDTVTVNVKFCNNGTKTFSNVTAYAKIPENTEVTSTNGVKETGIVSKTVSTFKADETDNLIFTINTDNFTDKSMVIPAYVKADGKEYPIGSVTIEIAAVTLSAPQVVKANTSFKVSGEALSGSTVEILNYTTKEVLATTEPTSKWYAADISGISESATLIAKVTKGDMSAYSEPVTVNVDDNPIAVKDVKIKWGYRLDEFGINKDYGYPTLSIWEGYEFKVSASFDNMPEDATVTYSFINKKNVPTTKSGEYYNGTIKNWNGYGTKKVIASVTAGDKKYDFVVAELIILIDPSGYISDAETGKPIAGAQALLEVKSGDEWIKWDATPHLQQNPMLTDENGHYGWMVPEGEYRIIVTADGYETKTVETYNSRDYGDNSKITVLPVRTDVDIQLVNSRAVEVEIENTAAVAGGKIKFVFSRPVDPATFTAENFKVSKADGTAVAGSLVLAENNTVALFKPSSAMENGTYTLSVANITDGSSNTIAAEDITFAKTADLSALTAPTIAYNADGTITITFANGKQPVNPEEIVVKNGNNVVNGTLRTADNVITFIPNTALTAGTTYTVAVSDAIRTAANEYLAAPVQNNVTTSGSSTPSNPGSSSGGGGGGSSVSVAKPTASIAAGEVEVGTKVTLSTTTDDAIIYYTLDGSAPTDKSSVYSEAITIKESVTLKAIAIKGKDKSSVLTVKYTVKNATDKPADKPNASAPVFADISNYAWAEKAITALTEKGIIKGMSDTEFAPGTDIKRADFMLLLIRMLDLKAEVTSNFDDVSADKYYYEGIGIAKALGLTSGVGNNKFNPEESITRQDMFVLAYRILKMQEIGLIDADESAIITFNDYASIADYAKEAMATLVKNDLVKGSYNQLNPTGNATRAETAVFIYSIYSLINK